MGYGLARSSCVVLRLRQWTGGYSDPESVYMCMYTLTYGRVAHATRCSSREQVSFMLRALLLSWFFVFRRWTGGAPSVAPPLVRSSRATTRRPSG